MRGVGIEAGSQIGRCRNRQSFKNQQNLQKAMEEARRLVMRSPLPGSPSFSPSMDIVDPTTNTLIELLRNITEEVGDDERLSVSVNDNRGPSPLHQLGAQLQAMLSKNPSPYQTTNLGKANSNNRMKSPRLGNSPTSAMFTSPPNENAKPSLSPHLSISRINSPPPKTEEDPAIESQCVTVKSPSVDNVTKKGIKSPEGGDSHSPKVRSPEPLKSVPPPIHITEPMAITTQETTDHLVDIDMEPEQRQDNPAALSSNTKSPPKVVKRKAPVPTDAIQRPVAPKPTAKQGMIPPPPSKADEPSVPCLNIPILSTTPATPLLKKKEEPVPSTDTTPPLPNTPPPVTEEPIITQPKLTPKSSPEPVEPAICVGIDATDTTTEKLISSPNHTIDANKAASSPICLRPYRKIEDVKTVKRQPKTGWL